MNVEEKAPQVRLIAETQMRMEVLAFVSALLFVALGVAVVMK
jgi:hypothetical protein